MTVVLCKLGDIKGRSDSLPMWPWPFYWVDWLLLQDAKNSFKYVKEAFEPFFDFDKAILKEMTQTTIHSWSSLEHWMAQTDVGVRHEDEDALMNSFGNLALIDPGLNSKLSNKWTDQKGAILKETSLQVIGLTGKEFLSQAMYISGTQEARWNQACQST